VFPTLIPRVAAELGLPNSTDPTVILATKAAKDICETHNKYCVGTNVQYNSTEECIDFIMNKVPFGDIWQAGQNTGKYTIFCDELGVKWGSQEYVVICITRWYEELILYHINLRFPRFRDVQAFIVLILVQMEETCV